MAARGRGQQPNPVALKMGRRWDTVEKEPSTVDTFNPASAGEGRAGRGCRRDQRSCRLGEGWRVSPVGKSAPRCMTYRMAGRCLPVGDKWCLRRGRRRPTRVPCRARGAVLRPQGSYPVGRHRRGGRRRGRPGSRLRKAPRDLLKRGVLRWPGWTSIKASSTRSRRGWISGHLTRLPWAGSSSTYTPRSSMRWSATWPPASARRSWPRLWSTT